MPEGQLNTRATRSHREERGLESNRKLAKVSSYATARLSIATVVGFLYTFPPG